MNSLFRSIFVIQVLVLFYGLYFANGYQIVGTDLVCANGTEKLTNQQALDYLAVVSIGVSSFGFCYDQTNPVCTSLDGIHCINLCYIAKYKKISQCGVAISAGTEVGHDKIDKPHTEGWRLNIRVDRCNNNFIRTNFTRIQNLPNGAPQYTDTQNNFFALEGASWNILVNQC